MLLLSISFSQVRWEKLSFSDACHKAAKENKIIMIKFYTDWCVPCKQIEKTIFTNDSEIVNYVNTKLIALSMNAETKGIEIAKRYDVAAYPTLLFINAAGEVIGKVVGTRSRDNYFQAIKTAGKSDIEYLNKMRKNSKKDKKSG